MRQDKVFHHRFITATAADAAARATFNLPKSEAAFSQLKCGCSVAEHLLAKPP
jgi:hypothetical protein